MTGPIPFDAIRDTALAQADRLLRDWFPRGNLVGREFKVGNLQGDVGESLGVNLQTGHWADFAAGNSGYDLIDLRAAMCHGGDRTAAARDLGAMLGVVANGHDHSASVGRHEQAQGADEWQPLIPPPADAPRPDQHLFTSYDAVHEYCGPDDGILFYVRRREAARGKRKQFHPLVYGRLGGKLGWHAKHPATPRPLYGLNRLTTMPGAPVLLCEGEKAANAAQALFPEHACLSWCGGAKSAPHADVAPLRTRSVIIWPDNDVEGHSAAVELCRMLPHARVLRVDDLPEGADAADVAPEEPETWLAERVGPETADAAADGPMPGLREFLAIEAWAERDIPPPDRLLGDLVTTTTRMFLVGRTGLGKTLLALALATGMANGRGFLHWRSSRPARVLVIDGEMPGELIRQRAIDTLRRAGIPPVPGNLMIYARDMEDDFARRFPTLGRMPPLNTEAGHNWVLMLIDQLGGVDVVIFDNVMSLIGGDMKDEVPWSDTLPLVQSLTGKRIGQVWLDHTGHNTDRQYGSSTKAWRFDAVGIMAPLPDDQQARGEVAFTLSFDHPGKARRRTPENWADFEACTIRLADDRWTSETAPDGTQRATAQRGIAPSRRPFYDALISAITRSTGKPGTTTVEAWQLACEQKGLIEAAQPEENYRQRDARYRDFRKAKADLIGAAWIAIDGPVVSDLKGKWG